MASVLDTPGWGGAAPLLTGIVIGALARHLAPLGALSRLLLGQRGSGKGSRASGPKVVESTIRLLSRVSLQHGAVNLSQGFPNEPPPPEMARAAAGAMLAGGSPEAAAAAAGLLEKALPSNGKDSRDLLSQYSFPFGLPLLRAALQEYYARFYPGVAADKEENITVVLGATEGFACSLRSICQPGDTVVFFEPFHELYPSQCTLWHLQPRAVTLYEDVERGEWNFRTTELEAALRTARALLLNTPHNPTGKVFTRAEMETIAALCVKHDVICVTDEIYEHILFDGAEHLTMAAMPGMADRTLIVNAVSKTMKATGWRVGWVVSPAGFTQPLRAVHDQLVLQAPTPLQYGAVAALQLPSAFFVRQGGDYAQKRDILLRALQAARFQIAAVPKGAYYMFADYRAVPFLQGLAPMEAAMKMTREAGVACVPGDNFYLGASRAAPDRGARYLRFCFVRSADMLAEAAERLRLRL